MRLSVEEVNLNLKPLLCWSTHMHGCKCPTPFFSSFDGQDAVMRVVYIVGSTIWNLEDVKLTCYKCL